jgi:hypothetical protein
MVRIRDTVMGVLEAAKDPGKREEILSGIQGMLMGVAQAAASVFIAIFARAIPILAHAFISASKDSLTGIGGWAKRKDDVTKGLYQSGQISAGQAMFPFLLGNKESAEKIDRGYQAQLRADLGAKGSGVESDVMAALGSGGLRIQASWASLERLSAGAGAVAHAASAAADAQADANAATLSALEVQADQARKVAGQTKTLMAKR